MMTVCQQQHLCNHLSNDQHALESSKLSMRFKALSQSRCCVYRCSQRCKSCSQLKGPLAACLCHRRADDNVLQLPERNEKWKSYAFRRHSVSLCLKRQPGITASSARETKEKSMPLGVITGASVQRGSLRCFQYTCRVTSMPFINLFRFFQAHFQAHQVTAATRFSLCQCLWLTSTSRKSSPGHFQRSVVHHWVALHAVSKAFN